MVTEEMKFQSEVIKKCSDCGLVYKKGIKRTAIWEKDVLQKVLCKECFDLYKINRFIEKNLANSKPTPNKKY